MFNSNDQSKKKFVENARLERENREKERIQKELLAKQANARITIQQWWRKRDQQRIATLKTWAWWDSQFSEERENIDMLDFLQMLGLYCILTRKGAGEPPAADSTTRLKKIIKHLSTNKFRLTTLVDKNVKILTLPFYTLLIDMRYMSQSRKYLEHIIKKCIVECTSYNTDSSNNTGSSSFGPELTFLLHYLNPKTYQTKHVVHLSHVIDIPDKVLQSTAQSMLKTTLCCQQSNLLLRASMTNCVQQVTKLEDRSFKLPPQEAQRLKTMKLWLTTMTRIALYPIENAELSSDALDMDTAARFLWNNTLAVPYIVPLINDAMADRLRKWAFGTLVPLLFAKQLKKDLMASVSDLSGNGCLFLLANLVDLWNSHKNSMKSEEEMRLIDLVKAFVSVIETYFSDRHSPLFPHYHPIFKWSKAAWGNTIPVSIFDKVMKQMEYIWSRSCMDQLFKDIIHFDDKANSRFKHLYEEKKFLQQLKKSSSNTTAILEQQLVGGGDIALFSMEVECIFSMYMSLTQLFKAHRNVIFYQIAFTPQLMPQLWKLMNQFGPKGNMAIYLDAAKKSNINEEPLVQVLLVFCEACSIVFMTLDDMDIFTNQKPFVPTDLIRISGFLNNFYFTLIKQQTNLSTEFPPAAESFKSARRLLLQIYDLDLRRPFCPPDHWLLVSMPAGVKSFFSNIFQSINNNSSDSTANNGTGTASASTTSVKKSSTLSVSLFLSSLKQGDPVPLRILQLMPHTVSFEMRLKIFRDWIALDRSAIMNTGNGQVVEVKRGSVLADGYYGLSGLSSSAWKGVLRVLFVNELGVKEAGIDQGGPFKDFITMLISEAFEPNYGLFAVTKSNSFYPSPTSSVYGRNHIQMFEFIGKVIGKALYEGILLDVKFTGFLLARLLGRNVFFEELKELDEDVWKSLTFIKHYEGDVEDLGLSFEVDEDVLGKIESHELKYRGKHTAVTNTNRIEYVYLMADYKLNQRAREQTKAFIQGFRAVISENWIRLFSPPELQRVLSGEDKDFDISDLRKHTQYQVGYFDQHPVIRYLWQIIGEFPSGEKRAFLKFVTGCPKPPLGGFSYLQPPFTVRMVSTDASSDNVDSAKLIKSFFKMNVSKAGRLPSSSTCFNLLKLPAYTKKSLLKEKLLYAINSNTGFELA